MGTTGDHRDRPAHKQVDRQVCQHCQGLGWIPVSAPPKTRPSEAERIQELVVWLDRADVPASWGRLQVSRVLREAGMGRRVAVIAAAVRFRRERGPVGILETGYPW